MALPRPPMFAGTIQITPRYSPRRIATSDRTLGELLHCLAHQPSLAQPQTLRRGGPQSEHAPLGNLPAEASPPIILADLPQLLSDLRREFARLSRRQSGQS